MTDHNETFIQNQLAALIEKRDALRKLCQKGETIEAHRRRSVKLVLPRIISAIAKITNPNEADFPYGICEECEEPIPVGRLEVHPEAHLCVHCKSILEQARPQHLSPLQVPDLAAIAHAHL